MTEIVLMSFMCFPYFFPQIALAVGVPTSSWGVRVRRFCGFVAGGGLSHRESLEV